MSVALLVFVALELAFVVATGLLHREELGRAEVPA